MKKIIIVCFLVFIHITYSQRVFTPSRPVLRPTTCFRPNKYGRIVRYISDQQTKCQYWQCVPGRIIPVSCGLQTYVSEFYEGDDYNPCTEQYSNLNQQFDCTRKGYDPDGTPTCIKTYKQFNVCKNGGEVVSQGNLCWCRCQESYAGFTCLRKVDDKDVKADGTRVEKSEPITPADLSAAAGKSVGDPDKPSVAVKPLNLDQVINNGPVELAEGNFNEALPASAVVAPPVFSVKPQVAPDGKFISGDPCPDGKAPRDFCAESGGCLNGGTCVNQCLGPICLCKPPYTAGRRCEKFQCVLNVDCMNGGTCSRGPSGFDPVATCTCLPGFTGPMCGTVVNN